MPWNNKELALMARPGVTYIEVSNAAQQLVAAGRTPTIETIRIALGTGSNSTLGAHLRTWKSKQNQTQQIATKENIPEELIAALKGVWDRVINQSEDKIQTIQLETQQELIELKQEVQRLQKDKVYWEQQYHQIKQERDGFSHENATIGQLLANAKIEIAILLEKISGTEQQNHEKQVHIDELHRVNQQIQGNLEHYRNASLEQRLSDQQRYEQQQKQLEQAIQKINQELISAKQKNEELNQQTLELNNLRMQLDQIKNQHNSTTKDLAYITVELAKKTQAQQYWEEQFQVLQVKFDEQNKNFIGVQTQYAILQNQLEAINIESSNLREQNKVLAHEKWVLGQEKSQLHGQLKQLQSYV